MTDKILLSIIIPIYNKEDYLPECLLSLKRQKFDYNVEILLVDDGSTDDSLRICNDITKKDVRYRIIHQSNQGVSAARNTGLAHASGKYIAWIDPDDYITDDWYSTVSDALTKEPDMLYFDMYELREGRLREVFYDKQSKWLSKQELCEELAIGYRMKSHLWSKIFLRTIFDQSFSAQYSYCEDYAVMHHICWNVNSCLYLHKSLYVYRQLSGSITHNKDKIIDNYRLGIKLNKIRFHFLKKKSINVSKLGVYFSILAYCMKYCKMGDRIDNRHVEIYKKYMEILRKQLCVLLCYKHMSFKAKVKACIFILGGDFFRIIYLAINRNN